MSQTKHEIRIEAIYKDLMSQGLVKSQKTIDAFEKRGKKATKEMTSGFDMLRGGVNRMGKSLTGVTARFIGMGAAIASVSKGVQVFVRTEKAMAEVATISTKVAGNIGEVGDQVGDLALRFGLAEDAVAKGLYQTISSGVTEPVEAIEALNTALGLSIAGIADSTATTDLLVSTLNAFGDAAGGAEHVADVMFSTVRQGKTTIGELAQAMSQVTPQAAALGVSMEETAAAVAAVTLSGAPTAEAVTQVRAAMTAMLKKTKDIDKALRERGIAGGFSLARLRSEGLLPVLRDLRNAYDGNEEGLTQLLGRVEGVNAIFNLTGDNLGRFQGIIDGNTESAGAYEAALDRMGKTADLKLRSAMEGVRQGLAELGGGFVQGVLGEDGLEGGLDAAETAARELRDTIASLEPALNIAGKALRQLGDAMDAWSESSDRADLSFQSMHMRKVRAEWLAGERSIEQVIDATAEYMRTYRRLGRVFGEDDFLTKQMALYVEIAALEEDWQSQMTDGSDVNLWGERFNEIDTGAENARKSVSALFEEMVNAGLVPGMAPLSAPPMPTPAAGPGASPSPGFGPQPATPSAPSGSATGVYGTGPFGSDVDWAGPGLTVEGGGGGDPMTKGPTGAAKAWADLHEQVKMTDEKAEAFTSRMISDLGHDATNAIMDFATGAASAEEAFANLATSFLSGMAEMIVQQLVFNAISGVGGFMGFADGGVAEGGMSFLANGGVVDGGLGAIGYANGGPVVTKPHLAMVGEGHYDEAVVPLTGGREIPVQIEGGGGGGATVNFNITAMDGADVERVVAKNPGTFRAVIEEAMLTNQSFRSAMRSVR